jgi:hypothetical protein
MKKLRKVLDKLLDLRAFDLLIWVYGALIEISVRRVLLLLALTGFGIGVYRIDQRLPIRPMLRDMAVAVYADHQAGDEIPWGPDYSMSMPTAAALTYGIEVNSSWLIDQVKYVVPYFAYEGIAGNPQYPKAAYFLPRLGVSSFTVGGQMHPDDWRTGGGWVELNERLFTDPAWIDEGQAFGTLVHELTHVQGGVFIQGTSKSLESATVAATTEMLAAMCIFHNDLACRSFWLQIEQGALASLASRLPEDVYDAFAGVFIRDATEREADAKVDRFWAGQESRRQDIREKYGRYPWEALVLPGVLEGRSLHTLIGAPVYGGSGIVPLSYMSYDDTAAVMGWRLRLFLWLTTVGREVQ